MRFLLVLGIALFTATSVEAQQGTSGLTGRVLDQQGAVLPGVTVTARNQDTGMFRQTISNEDGTYFFSGMTPGRYQLDGELAGFKKYQRKDVQLEVGKTASVDIALEVGSLAEEILVTEDSPIIDVTSKEVGGYIQNRELVDLPSVNRNFVGYLGLLPGVVPAISTTSFGADSINVNGQSVRAVNYSFDGADNNDSFNAGNGGSQARLPIEAVQEFQLLTSQFDAEFGRTAGGVVNAVSKQGGNQFHGSAFGFLQDSALTANTHFGVTQGLKKPETQVQQYGGTLGGPIVRDKAQFFLSLERVLQDRGVNINIPARPELSSAEVTKDRVWNTLVRFDHQINAKHTWSLRNLRETSPQFNQLGLAPPTSKAAADQERDIDYTFVGTLSSVLNPKTLNTIRVSITNEDVTFGNPNFLSNGGRQDSLKPTLRFLTFLDQQSARANRRLDKAYGVDETFALFVPDKWGNHDIKFGAQYLYTGLRFQNWGNLNGTFNFATDGPFDPANLKSYPERLSIRVPRAVDFLLQSHFISGFGQDKWKMNGRLTLSLGLRYDVEIMPVPERDNPQFKSPRDYPIDKNNFSPRVGFSYALDSANRTALRGGYGLFFQKTPFTYLTNVVSNGVFADSFEVFFPANNADPGPSSGRLPADPMLVNGPVLNRDLLNNMFPKGRPLPNSGDVWLDNPERRLSYSRQVSAGVERQLRTDLAISADYIRSASRKQFMRRDLNPGLRASTSRTATIVRVNPNFVRSVFQSVNLGWSDYDALQVQLDKRFSRRFSVRGSYTLSKARANSDLGDNDIIASQLLDDLRLDRQEGPTTTDRRHNLVISGTAEVPFTGGLKLSGVARTLSGTRFSIIDSTTDADRNGILFDFVPAGTYSGTGKDAVTVKYNGGRGGARGPGFFQLDLRGGYKFRLREQKTFEAFAEMFNATNRSNFNNPTNVTTPQLGSDRRLSDFLVVKSLRGGGPTRTAQFGVRFAF